MHYCSILETLYEQKTMTHSFNRPYMDTVEPTLGNLASKAGFAFFNQIWDTHLFEQGVAEPDPKDGCPRSLTNHSNGRLSAAAEFKR